MPCKYEDPLWRWCDKQRQLFKAGKLSDEGTHKLIELGFEWNLQKRKREDIEPQPLPPLAASINGNEENIHPNSNIVFEINPANKEHIIKKSKTCHDKSAETQKQNTDDKCKRLAKQTVDIAGGRLASC